MLPNFEFGLLVLWGVSIWQLTRAAVWGVVWYPGRRGDWNHLFTVDPWSFWAGVYVWAVLGPVFMIGTAVFLYIQRNDPV